MPSACSWLGFKKHYDKIKSLYFNNSQTVKLDEFNACIFEDWVTIMNKNVCSSKSYFIIRTCFRLWSLEYAHVIVWKLVKINVLINVLMCCLVSFLNLRQIWVFLINYFQYMFEKHGKSWTINKCHRCLVKENKACYFSRQTI